MLRDGAIGEHRRAVRAHQVVRDDRRLVETAMPWREQPVQVAPVGDDPRLVECRPHRHSIAKRPVHHRGIVGEPVGDVAIQPTAHVVERGREIPVIERDQRLDVAREQRVHQALIEREALRVDLAATGWQHACPGDRKPIALQSELAHQRDVLAPAVVVVAGDVAGVAVMHHRRRVREALPDARPRTVGEGRAFDLIRGRRRAPEEAVGKAIRFFHRGDSGSTLCANTARSEASWPA